MKLYLIDPHRQDFYNNGLFNEKRYMHLRIFSDIKKSLKNKGIVIDTIDLHDVKKADQIFFIDFNNFTLFFNQKSKYLKLCLEAKIPKNRMNLIIVECPIIKPFNWDKKNHEYFSRVFTWNDTLVDNKKYFHYLCPVSKIGINTKKVAFSDKKMLVMINMNKVNYYKNELYSLRKKAIRYFESYHPNNFDLYGEGWNKPLQFKHLYSAIKGSYTKLFNFGFDYWNNIKGYSSYKGTVKNKYEILSQYKYSICFENMGNIDGNLSEKIFDCFKAKCVPIYYGSRNIEKYIASNLFIDFREFNDFESLYSFLTKISETQYQQYISLIEKFLIGNKIKKWYFQNYCKNILLNKNILPFEK